MNEQQLAAFALANGAEVNIDGRVINPGRERFSLGRARLEQPPPPAPPEPARPAQAYATEAEVRAMLAARDAEWSTQLQQMTMLLSQVAAAQRPERPGQPPEWDFDVSYGPKGQITNIRALPRTV